MNPVDGSQPRVDLTRSRSGNYFSRKQFSSGEKGHITQTDVEKSLGRGGNQGGPSSGFKLRFF